MRDHDGRRKRILRESAYQILWALLLVYIILLGVAFLFGREVGYDIAFGVCGGVAVLVAVSFVAVYLLDRSSAGLLAPFEKTINGKERSTITGGKQE
jgi:hypothetical protein